MIRQVCGNIWSLKVEPMSTLEISSREKKFNILFSVALRIYHNSIWTLSFDNQN